jgi:hypothetical protein
MSRESIVEAAALAKLRAVSLTTITVGGTEYAVALRGTWTDDADGSAPDEETSDTEDETFPQIALKAGISFPEDGRDGPAWVVPLSWTVATYNRDDKKGLVARAIYDAMRTAIEADDLSLSAGDFDGMNVEESPDPEFGPVYNLLEVTTMVHLNEA